MSLFACNEDSGPLDGGGGELDLAGSTKTCAGRSPDTSISPLICELFPAGGNRNALLSQFDNIRRAFLRGNDDALFDQAIAAAGFVENKLPDSPSKFVLMNKFLALGGADPISDEAQSEGIVAYVNGSQNTTLISGNGLVGLLLPAGIWTGNRLVVGEPLPDENILDTSVRQFPEYVFLRTEPDDVFSALATVGLCLIHGDELDPPETDLTEAQIAQIRVAKNLDDNDDPAEGTPLPDGTPEEGPHAKYFDPITPGFSLPECTEEEEGPSFGLTAGASGVALQGGKRHGDSSASLAGRRGPLGGQVSSFSPFGLVLPAETEGSAPEITDTAGPDSISNAPESAGDNLLTVFFSDPDADITTIVIETVSGPFTGGSFDPDVFGQTSGSFAFNFGCFSATFCTPGDVTISLELVDAEENVSEPVLYSFHVRNDSFVTGDLRLMGGGGSRASIAPAAPR